MSMTRTNGICAIQLVITLVFVLVFAGCTGSKAGKESPNKDDQRQNRSADKTQSRPDEKDRVAEETSFPTFDWITINSDGWELVMDESKIKAWTDEDGDIITLVLYSRPEVEGNGLRENFPDLNLGVEKLREYWRSIAKEQNTGLVQADVKSIGENVLASVSISKSRMDPKGFEYSGVCVIPRKEFSFWILVSAPEIGTTGVRDAAVAKELLESGEITFQLPKDGVPGKIVGFNRDPYDSAHDEGALYNLSDQTKYDDRFPTSPITRVRTKLADLLDTLVLSTEVQKSRPYTESKSQTDSSIRE